MAFRPIEWDAASIDVFLKYDRHGERKHKDTCECLSKEFQSKRILTDDRILPSTIYLMSITHKLAENHFNHREFQWISERRYREEEGLEMINLMICSNYYSSILNTLSCSVVSADLKFTTLLMQYGYSNIDSCSEIFEAKMEILSFVAHAYQYKLIPQFELKKVFEGTSRLLFKLQMNNGQMDVNKRGFKRILLMAKLLYALKFKPKEIPYSRKFVKCFRLYTRITSDPYISTDEMEEFLRFFFENQMTEEALDYVLEMFENRYPESLKPFAPRSLRHLCRYTIRNIFANSFRALPDLVEDLTLPFLLKNYLLGAW